MPRLFKRKLRIEIGDAEKALAFEELFMKISISKFLSGTPDKGSVQIYNISGTREAFIKERAERIRVLAGYGSSDLKLLYDGRVQKVERDRAGNDRVANITLSADVFENTNTLINRSYQGAVPVRQIVIDALGDAGADYEDIEKVPLTPLEDYAFVGTLRALLEKILPPLGVEYYEDLGLIKFSEKGKADTRTAVVLNINSGLSGTPSITDKGTNYSSRMNGLITVGGVVKIESQVLSESQRAGEYTGFYKNIQVTHVGDNRTGDFNTNGIGVPI